MTRPHPRAVSRLASRRPILALAVCGLLVAAFDPIRSAEQKFYSDDPLATVPETGDASGAQEYDIDLFYDLSYNMFVTARRDHSNLRAQNINTIDEVPDSSWFTNRVGTRPLTVEEITRGPVTGPAPQPGNWTISREKSSGAAPGFTATDSGGHTWFVSFDAPANPDGATGAVVVSTKLFWALGYNQVEYFVSDVRRESLVIAQDATKRRPNGKRTPLTQDDIDEVLERADQKEDGSYRIAAGRMLPGKVLGGFKYLGTRPDDPNDLVPHEHRRELRALRVFGAWANLVDQKAGNTLDTVITDGKRGVVKHYLQDVGSTFGVGANAPHDWNEGWEYVIEGGPAWRKLFTLGLARSEYQKADYEDVPAAGRFEGDSFDPLTWRPRVPTGAHIEMRDDDAFWAARRLMAVTDELIRAAVKTGQYRDPAGRTAHRRRAHQATRQDRPGLPAEDQPDRRSRIRRHDVDLRQRRRPVQGRRGAGVVHRRVVAVRQRHRYGDANRRHHEQGAEGGGPERAAHHPGLVRQGGAQCAEHESPVLGAADRRLLQARRHRLETGWPRADARRRCSGAAEGELSHGPRCRVVRQAVSGHQRQEVPVEGLRPW